MAYERRRPDWWINENVLDDTLDPADLNYFESTFEDIDVRVADIEENGVIGPSLGVEQSVGTSFNLRADQNAARIVATAPLVVGVPEPGTLGNGFECSIWNDSAGTVTVSGVGDFDMTLAAGEACKVGEVNGKQFAWKLNASTRLDNSIAETLWNPLMLGPDLVLWWDARENVSYDQFSFAVSSWSDRASGVIASQATTNLRPFYDPTEEEMRFSGNLNLSFPGRSRAYQQHHWLACTFRINWSTMSSGTADGSFFSVNGYSGGVQRQPYCGWTKAGNLVGGNWLVNGVQNRAAVAATGDEEWHTMVSRRTPEGVYVSVDGGAETFLAGSPSIDLPNLFGNTTALGIIGNYRTSNNVAEFGIDSIVVGQRYIESEDVDKLHGWGLWRVGAEDKLPVDHPYALNEPPVEATALEPPDGEDATAYPDFVFDDFDQTHKGTDLDRTGFSATFADEFDWVDAVANHITDGSFGTGPWYTPARSNTSLANFRKPNQTNNPFFIETPSVLTIKMTKDLTNHWYTGLIQTVNTMGEGFSQKYGYFEARIKIPPAANAWPAFWMYSTDASYVGDTATRAEIDILECYATDPNRYHGATHRHVANRKQPDHLAAHESVGMISDLTDGVNGPIFGFSDGAGGLFDDEWHTYGVLMTSTEIRIYIDDLEIGRKNMYPEADTDCFMVLALQMQDTFISSAVDPTYMYIDWVRAWEFGGVTAPDTAGTQAGDTILLENDSNLDLEG